MPVRIRCAGGGGHGSSVRFEFYCASCGAELDDDGTEGAQGAALYHPEFKEKFSVGGFLGITAPKQDPRRPIECGFAGARCLHPMLKHCEIIDEP